ncbi:MAG TPA: amidase family protein [Candidatus Cybelea sp.]|nr:amidase family protein [Candidatus Cybelea sp.]
MSDADLCYLPALEALKRFRARKLSPVDLVKALIARHETVGRKVNAFAHTFFDRALDQAREAEARFAKRGAKKRALEGIPVVIKDLHPIKGEITTGGCKAYADRRDTVTAPTVQRLLDAGAILLARSTSSELGIAAVTDTPLWGATRNPWNLDYTAGGSSGGAGAALAAGLTTLADGSDGGGSVRIPAAVNGVFGYKPPYGRNPIDPPSNLDTYLHFGPLARTVADARLMQSVMAGWHPNDIASLRNRVALPTAPASIKGWRIAFSMDLGYYDVDHEVQANTRHAVDTLRKLGAVVEEVEIGWTRAVLRAGSARAAARAAAKRGDLLNQWRDQMSDGAVAVLEQGKKLGVTDLIAAEEEQGRMYSRLGEIFKRHRLLVCPTTALPAVPATFNPGRDPLIIANKVQPSPRQWYLTYPFNMLGQLPVASIPSGFASSGVPTALQIVGRTYDDASVFRTAFAFEKAMPFDYFKGKRPKL